MTTVDVIAAKRDGRELSTDEIRAFVRGVVDGNIPDYQVSAWLMAVTLRGMTFRETLDLTFAMRDSGGRVDLSDLPGPPALDKHSTGGVGDKVTLVVVPLLAACGVPILKMSGRGLGFSGGTIDKLESIPGFRADLGVPQAKEQVRRLGAAVIAQTTDLAPADRILYALRDVTATIESLPLIVSSIMSKKLAAGAERILLDVKVGSGSFMRTRAQAEELARGLIAVGQAAGVPTNALLTDMDQPLGRMVGNSLEVQEAIQCLLGDTETEPCFRALCVEVAAHGLLATDQEVDLAAARSRMERTIHSGAGAAKFAALAAAQGGPIGCEAILTALPQAPIHCTVASEIEGHVAHIDARHIGQLSMALGAGRAAKSDPIDPAAGIQLHCKVGDRLQVGQAMATLHLGARNAARADEFAGMLRNGYTVVPGAGPVVLPHSTVLAKLP